MATFTDGLARVRGGVHTFAVLGVEVDVVPFGGIEEDRAIRLPDGHVLDVNGIAEALKTSIEVRLPRGTVTRVASLPAQAVLKILAWRDRRFASSKDAQDLKAILTAASEGPYEDETWDDELALAATESDIILAGPYRAGRLAAEPFDKKSAAAVLRLLEDADLARALVRDMGGRLSRDLLPAFTAGFRSGMTEPRTQSSIRGSSPVSREASGSTQPSP
jgi:predicted nucleotidyltransferase